MRSTTSPSVAPFCVCLRDTLSIVSAAYVLKYIGTHRQTASTPRVHFVSPLKSPTWSYPRHTRSLRPPTDQRLITRSNEFYTAWLRGEFVSNRRRQSASSYRQHPPQHPLVVSEFLRWLERGSYALVALVQDLVIHFMVCRLFTCWSSSSWNDTNSNHTPWRRNLPAFFTQARIFSSRPNCHSTSQNATIISRRKHYSIGFSI